MRPDWKSIYIEACLLKIWIIQTKYPRFEFRYRRSWSQHYTSHWLIMLFMMDNVLIVLIIIRWDQLILQWNWRIFLTWQGYGVWLKNRWFPWEPHAIQTQKYLTLETILMTNGETNLNSNRLQVGYLVGWQHHMSPRVPLDRSLVCHFFPFCGHLFGPDSLVEFLTGIHHV